ncbi:M3 family metallopeptidase [Veronia pacifica]|uniref:Peptidase M3 n=1 Tax=Veronia pacifica TaxID=1080227 RepID=A0A1C3ERN5_9GAMM|nr:M3 family metallopeptidase [Veronia pacifica]ODA35884.1 peptidase M3 [Veronia pacifica]
MTSPATFLHALNHEYLSVHQHKEKLFWQVYMGISDDQQALADAEKSWNDFVSDADRIEAIKQQLDILSSQEPSEQNTTTKHGLEGWLNMFSSHVPETDQAAQLKRAIIDDEAVFFKKRKDYTLSYVDESGNEVEAGLPVLSAVISTHESETVRKSAHDALLRLEQWVLENGFIDMVKQRNAYARAMGFANYFDYSAAKKDQMPAETLMSILNQFEEATRDACQRGLDSLVAEHGNDVLKPYNFGAKSSGDAVKALEQYLPFAKSVERWIESFSQLHIPFSNAELTLDLLEREGKYQNGFCHGPTPSFYDQGRWQPAKVAFTSNAKPNQSGCGYRELNTLFHEGGHAAHFANVRQNAPCFAQEFAPTTMAYAETQSMFCDSLLGDAEWLKTYAKDQYGETVPDDVIKAMISSGQPLAAYSERSILVVPLFEHQLYAMDESTLTPESITALIRRTEKSVLGFDVAPRPILAIPHLLTHEYACAYHGYLLAHMAVYQTRAYFIDKYGYLSDNPEIGPALAEHYWNPGNSHTHDQTLRNLTGEGFNPAYLADHCNQSTDDAWQEQIQRLARRTEEKERIGRPLDAKISLVDGETVIATNELSDADMCASFESYVKERYFA